MLELTEKRLASLLWMMENKGKKWSVLELNKGAPELSYRPTFSFVKELEEIGFVKKDPKTAEHGITKVVDLVRFVSLARPIQSLKTVNFHSPFEFSKTLKMVQESKLSHAFTVFAGSELYRSYVKTDQVHVYIRKGEEEKWNKFLLSKNCLKAQKNQANLFLIPTEQEALFKDAAKIKGHSVVPVPILLSDLFSFGGLAEEQANFLVEEWLNNRV